MKSSTVGDEKAPPPRNAATARGRIPRIRSTDLLGDGRRVIIEHGYEDYCLLLTRNQRLILTKN